MLGTLFVFHVRCPLGGEELHITLVSIGLNLSIFLDLIQQLLSLNHRLVFSASIIVLNNCLDFLKAAASYILMVVKP